MLAKASQSMFGVTVRSWKSLRTSYGPKRPSCKRSDRKESFLAFYRTRWLLMEMKHPDQIQKPDLADCAEIGFLWVALEEEMLRNRYLCRTTTLFMLPL